MKFDKFDIRTLELEKPLELRWQKMIAVPFAGNLQKSYDMRVFVEEAYQSFSILLRAQATCLYSYAMVSKSSKTWTTKIPFMTPKRAPASLRDHILHAMKSRYESLDYKLRRARSNLIKFVKAKWTFKHRLIPKWPRFLEPKYDIFRVVTVGDRERHVERVQEALIAQIMLLESLDVEPQAILSNPEIYMDLISFQRQPPHYPYWSYTSGGPEFMGLRVIPVKELDWGAIVV